MNKNRIGTGLMIIGIGMMIFGLYDAANRQSQHCEQGTVISIQRLDNQIVRFETKDGNLWDEEFTLDTPIDIGDKAILTFEDSENENREEDIITKVEFEN